MTSLMGEIVGSRTKGAYKKSTTSLAVMNGCNRVYIYRRSNHSINSFWDSTKSCCLGPGSPLFNAPPVFTVDPINNLHTYLTSWEFFLYGAIGLHYRFVNRLSFFYELCKKSFCSSDEACKSRSYCCHVHWTCLFTCLPRSTTCGNCTYVYSGSSWRSFKSNSWNWGWRTIYDFLCFNLDYDDPLRNISKRSF